MIMATIEIRKFRMNYKVAGKGFPLLFVHGLGGSIENWDDQFPVFSKKYRVYTIDLRGHGESEIPEKSYSLDSFTDDVVEFLKVHGVEKCYYVGLSMGGMIGQNLALNHPDLLQALVLADTASTPGLDKRPDMEEARNLFETSAKIAEEKGRAPLADATIGMMFTKNFIDNHPDKVEKVKKRLSDGPSMGYVRAIRNIFLTDIDLLPEIGEIKIPTLVIVGRQDILTPLKASEIIHETIRASRLEIIDDCGHVSCIEKPDEFNKILMGFLHEMDAARYEAPKVERVFE